MNEKWLANIRELVGDATKSPALHAVTQSEAARIIEAMRDPSFSAGSAYADEELARRVAAYEGLTEDLARAASLIAYWAQTTDERLVPGLVARLANACDRSAGQQPYLDLYLYPAVLVMYGGGLGAVIGKREEQLAALLAPSSIQDRHEWKPIATVLSGQAAIDQRNGRKLPGMERHHTPASDRIVEVMKPWLEELEPSSEAFERAFDRWEYLLGLVAYDTFRQGRTGGWGPVGRFSWRGERTNPIDQEIGPEIAQLGANWPLVRAGLFGGDQTRLKESVEGWHQHIAAIRREQW